VELRITAVFKLVGNYPRNPVDVREHIAVAEAQDLEALTCKVGVPLSVSGLAPILEMRFAIHLDD
jgi:hypothetical protein